MFVLNSNNNDILSLWEFEFSIDENIEFNKRFWNESKSNFDLRTDLTNSKIFILLNLITYSILLDFSWFLTRWNAFEKRYNYDLFYVCDAHWMTMRESAKLLMFELWKVDFSIELKTSNKNCSDYFIIERVYYIITREYWSEKQIHENLKKHM